MTKLSVLILAKNEQHHIKIALTALLLQMKFWSLMILVQIIRNHVRAIGARVIQRAMNGDWGGQQTFAIQQASYEWILF